MASVFINHASVDRALVDDVQGMIQRGVGLSADDFFYSSGDGTGVPAGHNFVDYIREQMQGSTFVVSIITPAFRESEFCLAELGAVWLAANKDFYPLCVPSIDRSALEATLNGLQVERIDDSPALVGLLDRLCTHFERNYNAVAGNGLVSTFLASLPSRLESLTQPTKVAAGELERANATIAELGGQLATARDELAAAERRFGELEQAKTREEIDAVTAPATGSERLQQLCRQLRDATLPLPRVVADCLPFHLRKTGMPWPDDFDYAAEEVRRALDDGLLTEGHDSLLYLNKDWPDVADSIASARQLQSCLKELSADESEWFKRTYRAPPDISQRAAFRKVVR